MHNGIRCRLIFALLLALIPCSTFAQFSPAEDESYEINGSLDYGEMLDPGTERSRRVSRISGYTKRPDAAILSSVMVEWQKPVRDELGIHCKIRGQLRVPKQEGSRPVDWFQGVTVYLAAKPAAKRDWSKGLREKFEQESTDNEVAAAGFVKQDGTFEISVDLRQFQSQREVNQTFQVGLALAEHTGPYAEQEVTWNTQVPVIPSTIRMLDIPPAPALPRELELIHRVNGWPGRNPNGVDLIRAVNALRLLGKERALATLEKYKSLLGENRPSAEEDAIFWIVLLLFEPIQAGDRPELPVEETTVVAKTSPEFSLWPLYPIELVRDVPLYVEAENGIRHNMGASMWLPLIRRGCVLREFPMSPTSDPLSAVEALCSSPKFKRIDEDFRRLAIRDIRRQAVAMVPDLLKPLPGEESEQEQFEVEWQARLDEAQELQIEWDAKTERFVSHRKSK